MYEMFCTRTPEQLASRGVYEKVHSNCLLLHECHAYLLEHSSVSRVLPYIHLLSLHRMLCSILLLSVISLCETYMLATTKFRQTRDCAGYKIALFTHKHNLHHADINYHCSCHEKGVVSLSAILASTFLDKCAVSVSRAYNVHCYADISAQERDEDNTVPLTDLIKRIMQAVAVLYAPLVLPPDVLGSTRPASSCSLCSRDAVMRGTMALTESEAVCTCSLSMYTGTNIDGGRHANLVSARRYLLDTTQKSMCLQVPLCDCLTHRESFASILRQLSHALTGENQHMLPMRNCDVYCTI